MATIDDLCLSITEIPFNEALARIMVCRNARRAALTEARNKRAAAGTKTKSKSKKTKSPDELANALSSEQKAQLLAMLTGD